MESNLLNRFLPRTEFTSYEDFKDNYRVTVPENFNFGYDIVDEYARIAPRKKALVWCNDRGDEKTFTFADIKEQSDKAANLLSAIGIKKGDPVMLIMKKRYEFWFCLIALHKLGAICIPASHLLTARDIVYRNTAANIKMVIVVNDERLLSSVEEAEAQSPSLEHKVVVGGTRDGWHSFDEGIKKASSTFERPTGAEATANDDTSMLYFTSGTTGMPKMVQHDFTYPLGHIITAKYWQNVRDNGIHFTIADTGWAKFAWGKVYGQWIAGSAVFAYDYENKFDPKKLLGVLDRHRITTFCAPATAYRMIMREEHSKESLRHLKECVVAGEPLYPEVFNEFKRQTGIPIREGFGQSETAVAVGNFPWMDCKPGSMGKPSPTYDVDLVHDDGRPCLPGERGHIVFRMDNGRPSGMFRAYYKSHELTSAAIHDGLYFTGDIAWRDEDGYYWYVGRADDTIKSSGYKIGPFEVESVLQEHPAVHECAVTGVPDPIRGQLVKATIVLHEGYAAGDDLAKEIQDFVKKMTAPYKYPRVIEFAEALPKTHSGKISRRTIRSADKKKSLAAAGEK